MKTKSLILCLFLLSSSLCLAQLKVDTGGKVSVGSVHSLNNGSLKIGNDGAAQGISFYSTSAGGTDFRIYRSGNIAFLTRGGNNSDGLRISSTGQVAIGSNQVYSSTSFGGRFHVYSQDDVAICSRAYDTYDYGDAQKSLVFRPLSVVYAGWYNNNKTFYALGNGNVYSNGILLTSDISLKSDVQTITSPLSKVLQLRGVTFDMNFPLTKKEAGDFAIDFEKTHAANPHITKEIYQQIYEEQKRKRMGVVAQEVEKIVPEVVRTRDDGLKAVAYSELTGLLIEAIKEQQNQIESLKEELAAVKDNAVFEAHLRSSTGEDNATGISNAIVKQCKLYQNAPNPFSEKTEIKYFLPQDVQQASVCIFDMQGKLLKKLNAPAGENTLIIKGSELHAGMYLYSLIADGKEVDTKRMILTK